MPLDRESRIYRGRPRTTPSLPVISPPPCRKNSGRRGVQILHFRKRADCFPRRPHASALELHVPPSALVDDCQTILHLSPTAGRFILHSAGPFSGRLPAVVRPELRLDLRLALVRALEQKLPTLARQTIVDYGDEKRRIAMHVAPIRVDDRTAAQVLVFFLDGGVSEPAEQTGAEAGIERGDAPPPCGAEIGRRGP